MRQRAKGAGPWHDLASMAWEWLKQLASSSKCSMDDAAVVIDAAVSDCNVIFNGLRVEVARRIKEERELQRGVGGGSKIVAGVSRGNLVAIRERTAKIVEEARELPRVLSRLQRLSDCIEARHASHGGLTGMKTIPWLSPVWTIDPTMDELVAIRIFREELLRRVDEALRYVGDDGVAVDDE